MRLMCLIISSASFQYFGLGLAGSFALNSQMATSLSQICVLCSTLAMLSFPQDAIEEYIDYENL